MPFFEDLLSNIPQLGNEQLEECADLVKSVSAENAKLIFVGNGGSAAIASHLAVDFTKAVGVRAITFNEPSLLTCFGNDFGYSRWVTEALRAYSDSNDLIVLISSSGQSQNILNAADFAKEAGLRLMTLSGFSSKNPLRVKGQINWWVNSENYNVVEMTHHIWLLGVVELMLQSRPLEETER